jgi:hypothetical protein
MRSIAGIVLAVAGSVATLGGQERPDLRATLANRVDVAKRGVGIVVGTLTPGGRSFVVHGRTTHGGAAVSADTVFEIGSITTPPVP